MAVKALAMDVWADVVIDALAGVIIVVTGIGVVFADANTNVSATVMTAFEFAMPVPLEESMLFC